MAVTVGRSGGARRSWPVDADRVEHVGELSQLLPRPAPQIRVDDDDRAVDVEDQQGLDLARFVVFTDAI